MIERILAAIGALFCVSVVLVALFLAASAFSLHRERHRRAESKRAAESTARRNEQVASDATTERIRHAHAVARGRIHHPKGHPVEQTSIDDLMPRVIEVPE